MPELPEVESVRRGLEHTIGETITRVEVLHPRPVRDHPVGPEGFVADLTGRAFATPRRRGKYLWFPLTDGDALLAHLGMSGQFRIDQPGAPHLRNTRVVFTLGNDTELRFVDQRMFGGLSLSPGGAELPDEVRHIAPDPFDPSYDEAAVVARMFASRSGVKRLLLNQSLVSGYGNIYADEALWRARLHFDRAGQETPRRRLRDLLVQGREVMAEALEAGGTSFDALYVHVNGESGYFDRSLDAYGQEGRPCRRCGTLIVRQQFMNRSSFFCPKCQPKPRRMA